MVGAAKPTQSVKLHGMTGVGRQLNKQNEPVQPLAGAVPEMIVDEVVKRPFSQGKVILHFFDENDKAAREFVARYLEESGRVHKMGAGRKVVYHRAHVPQTQNHLHFYLGNNHLYALNQDGSAHDASHGKQMHRWAMDAIKTKFDNFSIPPKGIIESMFVEDDRYLAEASAGPKIFIPPTAISIALNIATLSGS